MKRKHPAVERRDIAHASSVKRWCNRYHSQYTPPPAPVQDWKPKNPGIIWPEMRYERALSKEEWRNTGFPTHPPPDQVVGVVKVEVWERKIQELLSESNVNWGLVRIMREVLDQGKQQCRLGLQFWVARKEMRGLQIRLNNYEAINPTWFSGGAVQGAGIGRPRARFRKTLIT